VTKNDNIDTWVNGFWQDFLPSWIARTRDTSQGGFFDTLDSFGMPVQQAPKTVLTQARLLYTFAHLALRSGNPLYQAAARVAYDTLAAFKKSPGCYRRAVSRTGGPTGTAVDAHAYSYDQSFVLLALATWHRLTPDAAIHQELEACWHTLATTLSDPATGLLLDSDDVSDPGATGSPLRAQNPHMHGYEACLQAYDMTRQAHWLQRAATLRTVALHYFFDRDSGSIIEFLAPDLTPLPGRDGTRREVGHQCEWAWLLHREADLGGPTDTRAVAARLLAFAQTRGFANQGVMCGAAFDAVSADGSWCEPTFLLWPQTEALKIYAYRYKTGELACAARAIRLATLIFTHYFGTRTAFVNQLDAQGTALWPEALSRLLYHLVLALTEGASAGLWPEPPRHPNGAI